jgi:hypothetical protein
MPGRKSYGPGGKWIHDRAKSLMDGRKKNSLIDQYGEKKGKSIAYAIATQQAHKVKKSPKGFRTPEGVRAAKAKFDKPLKEYQKTASISAFFDELEKIAQEIDIARAAQDAADRHRAFKSARGHAMSLYGPRSGSARRAVTPAAGRVMGFLRRLAI